MNYFPWSAVAHAVNQARCDHPLRCSRLADTSSRAVAGQFVADASSRSARTIRQKAAYRAEITRHAARLVRISWLDRYSQRRCRFPPCFELVGARFCWFSSSLELLRRVAEISIPLCSLIAGNTGLRTRRHASRRDTAGRALVSTPARCYQLPREVRAPFLRTIIHIYLTCFRSSYFSYYLGRLAQARRRVA